MAQRAGCVRTLWLLVGRLPDHTKDRAQSWSGLVCGDRPADGSPFFGSRGKRLHFFLAFKVIDDHGTVELQFIATYIECV